MVHGNSRVRHGIAGIRHRVLGLLFLLSAVPFVTSQADTLTPEKARRRAQVGVGRRLSAERMSLRARSASAYLFADSTSGFVLTSADDRLPAVLGYGTWAGHTVPAGLLDLIAACDVRLRQCGADAPVADLSAPQTVEPVPPLLTTVRHQGAPYNAACPRYRYSDGTLSDEPCVVGCVATALEQIITYYRRNLVLRDTLHGWSTPNYDIADIMPGTAVDTRLILDDYDVQAYTQEQADAVARLSYYCGVAARMNWTPGSSGTRLLPLLEPLQRAFGFGFVHYADSYRYTPTAWEQMLGAEISAGRPVLLTGFAPAMNGHAYVIDGRDDDGFFHVNWGEGGTYDGFFRLDILHPAEPKHDLTSDGATEGLSINLEALLLHPDSIAPALPDTIIRTGSEIAVDSVCFEATPETGKYTPMRIYFRNTSDVALTTPFEIFTNAPGDTALFDQADFIALTTVTLKPGERCERLVPVTFGQSGERVLRLSPDDEAIVFARPLHVAAGRAPELQFDVPEVSFPEPGTAVVRERVANIGSERAGHRVAVEVARQADGATNFAAEGTTNVANHAAYVYTPAGQSDVLEMRFRGLEVGAAYTLTVRCPWTPQQTLTFVVPDADTGLSAPVAPAVGELWYTPDGRRVALPDVPGLYLRRRGGRTEKVFVR